jgi:integrase/recombinase XerC
MELLCKFAVYLKSTDRASSAQFYCSDLKKFYTWFETRYGSFNPAAITPLDLVEYRSYLQSNGGRQRRVNPSPQPAASATVNRALISLSIFCRWAQDEGIMVTNPSKGIKLIATEELAPHWLTRSQQAAFLRAVQAGKSLRDLAVCGLMLHAGLRVGEVCALTRNDLVLQQRSGSVKVRRGKGNKQRLVPLNATIRKILLDYLITLPLEQSVLFASLRSEHITPRGVQHIVNRYAYNAHLDSVTPHTLRHSFCKNLIDVGVSLDKVALLAGHASVDITRRYTTPSEQDLQQAVEHLAWE